eukprot:scaffold4976_cov161-Amphora_coffeaeformis.AAC.25
MGEDDHRRIPLMALVENAASECSAIQFLLRLMKERGQNTDTPAKQGGTALHYAVPAGRSPLYLVGYSRAFTFVSVRPRPLGSKVSAIHNFWERHGSKNRKSGLRGTKALLSYDADATLPDAVGNLPFFLAAKT